MGLWEGISVSSDSPKITHLQYADDTIIPPNMEYLQNIKKTLIIFHLASGLKVNYHKSLILGLNTQDAYLA